MNNNFDDQWEDFDDEVIEQCILLEQTQSQVPHTDEAVIDSKNEARPTSSIVKEGQKHKHISGNSNKNIFPSLSNFNEAFSRRESNASGIRKVPNFQASFNNKIYNPIPVKIGNVRNDQTLPLPVRKDFRDLTQPAIQNLNIHNGKSSVDSVDVQLEKLQKEKQLMQEESLIKQGEVLNLRCELKRRETELENERIDQCLALEAAEKRGKEKSAKTLAECEVRVKLLEAEIEKQCGNIAFKNREVEELLSRCHQLEQLNQNSHDSSLNRRTSTVSPTSKRFKRDLNKKESSSNVSYNFADRFDFNDKKRPVKNSGTQTSQQNSEYKRPPTLPVISKRGVSDGNRKCLFLAMASLKSGKTSEQDASYQSSSELDGVIDLISQKRVLLLKDAAESSPGVSVSSNDIAVKSVCLELENILKQISPDSDQTVSCQTAELGKQIGSAYWYETSVVPLFNVLLIVSPEDETTTLDAVRIVALHLQPLQYQGTQLNNHYCLKAGLKSLLSLGHTCRTVPLSLGKSLTESFLHCVKCLNSDVSGRIPVIQAITSFVRFKNFKQHICQDQKTFEEQCLLFHISTLFDTEDIFSEDEIHGMITLVGQLLQPPVSWLTADCPCAVNLLFVFVKHLNKLSTMKSMDWSWRQVISGIRVMHLWQLTDENWWERIASLPAYTTLMGSVVRKCKKLKAQGEMDQYVWELLYDLHCIDEHEVDS